MTLRIAAVAAALAALASAAGASGGTIVTKATASGPGAVATASGSASHPRLVIVSIAAVPSQPVIGTWSVTCSNGFDAGPKGGQVATIAPLKRTFTFAANGPAMCRAKATARLSGDGRITVQIIRR